MPETSEGRGTPDVHGRPSPSTNLVPAAPDQNGSPEPDDDLDELDYPWTRSCPAPLRPWLDREAHCRDPWTMADQSGLLHLNQDVAQWWQDPAARQRPDIIKRLREDLTSLAWERLTVGWAHRRAGLEALPSPVLPRDIVRLLPPQASQILEEAWLGCLEAMLWEDWMQGPTSTWTLKVLVRPFSQPDPAPIPPPPVDPGPRVWLAWTSPATGRMEPLLSLATHPPMAGEVPELRHRDTGMIVVPMVVGTAVSLEQPQTESIIRVVAHYGGVWIDETSP